MAYWYEFLTGIQGVNPLPGFSCSSALPRVPSVLYTASLELFANTPGRMLPGAHQSVSQYSEKFDCVLCANHNPLDCVSMDV